MFGIGMIPKYLLKSSRWALLACSDVYREIGDVEYLCMYMHILLEVAGRKCIATPGSSLLGMRI